MIQIFATNLKTGVREEITDLYWFEEEGIHDFNGMGLRGQLYAFEIIVSGIRVYPSNQRIIIDLSTNPPNIRYD